MKNTIVPIFLCLLIACSGSEMETSGDVSYKLYGEGCQPNQSLYWLIDLEAKNSRDSVFIDTRKIKRKAELKTDQVNMNSSIFKVLKEVCNGDSAFLVLRADSFYSALKLTVPPYLKGDEKVNLMMIIHDRLDSIAYTAYKRAFEQESMKRYVEKFQWDATYDSFSGIYYEKLKTLRAGLDNFSKMSLKYVIKTIDDQLVAFSKDDDPLWYQKGDSLTLKGIAYLAEMLNTGESLQAIVPSSMAYGRDGKNQIRPYMPIILELECLERIRY